MRILGIALKVDNSFFSLNNPKFIELLRVCDASLLLSELFHFPFFDDEDLNETDKCVSLNLVHFVKSFINDSAHANAC